MRVLELTAHVQSLNRARGRSATAAAAYRACDRIECDRENRVHDYRAKAGLEAKGIVVPGDAPAWSRDRSRLWNAVELRERNGKRGANAGAWKTDALVAREVLFGFPAELSAAGREALAGRIARHLVEAHGVAVDWAIHAPGKLGDQRNHHCHMMFTTRRLTVNGLTTKTREWNVREGGGRTVSALRATLAAMMNEALTEEGHGNSVLIEHRSLKARGIARTATTHQGPGRTNARRNRQARERQAWERDARKDQAAEHDRERTELAKQQENRAELRHRDIDRREARAPVDLRATFQAERDRIAVDQQREARALDDRHQADDRQLDRAATHRIEQDRHAELMDRRSHIDGRTHERVHDHDRERQNS